MLRSFKGFLLAASATLLLSGGNVMAEPYLAVETGLKCMMCHTNPSGGGKRNVFGMTIARTRLAERTLTGDGESPRTWDSSVNEWLGIGGDWRGGYRDSDVPGSRSLSETAVAKSTVYAEIRAIPDLLTFYFDEQLSPGRSLERERYVLLTPMDGKYTIKAGQFFLPFGLRLQDDAAFVRQRSGINFDTPDDGIEFGLELPRWSAQVAFTNGTAGAGSVSGKDQTSLSAVYVLSNWRIGASYNLSDDPLGDRDMLGLFAGWRTGKISWLAEVDFITDEVPGARDQEIFATLVEGNWRFLQAHNLKLTYEFLDPSNSVGEDEEERYSLVWEYSPIQLLQARVGLRFYNGVPLIPVTNRDEVFAELHFFF